MGATFHKPLPLQHVPDVPGGRLGWLADHTRMTATLTRLVMAAHAPRRRLAHVLDDATALTDSLRQIPQVLPADLAAAHLAPLFTSRPAGVGLFASLCLARTHRGVSSWARAAQVLDLEASLGERTARACSAFQTGSPQDVLRALTSAAAELHTDHREMEDHVRRMSGGTRWFTRWARTHRSGTRRTSQAWWLWANVAGGHPRASPARTTTARAQKFASSLTSLHARTLSAAVSTATDR